MSSFDVVIPFNLIQQMPYIHHSFVLYGNPLGMASSLFENPVPVPAVVTPPLQTQLHHRCGMVMSHATPNGNPVNCQNNMESQGGCGKWVCIVRYEGVSDTTSFPCVSKCVKCCLSVLGHIQCVRQGSG